VVEVDVREQKGARLFLESCHQRVHAARRPRIDDQPVDLVGADDPVAAEVHDID
jgi:hypothetical protein